MPVLLLVPASPLYLASPEFRFLARWLEGEARAAFGAVERHDLGEAARDRLGDASAPAWVLVAEPEAFAGRATLAALAAALAGAGSAAGWGAPRLLAEVASPPAAPPVRTQRVFERLESAVLAQPAGEAAAALPISLWRRSALAAAAAAAGSVAAALDGARGGIRCGLGHRFVGYYGQRRDDVLPLLRAPLAEVLEIGCGDGATGELLQQRLGCRVTGVELNPVAAATAARRLHRVLCADVEQLELDGRFDLVLALELFEHLTEQEAFLARIRPLLEPDGTLLLSVPNVGAAAVVEDLIAGRFDYLPVGLLCYTHYRFFTRATLASWLERSGFSRLRFVPQPGELPERLVAAAAAAGLEVDRDSLATLGFFVLAQP